MQIEKRHTAIYKRVKSMLPRRESERRIHPLFRHCDILSAVETRISMLSMTYMKYIQNNMCCFIPGKVLDELDRVLSIVEKAGTPPRTHEILQELRDISSMAIEYFDEKILPSIKGQTSGSVITFNRPLISPNKTQKVFFLQSGLQDEIRKISKVNKKQKEQIAFLSKFVHKLYAKVEKQKNLIKSQTKVIQEHESKLQVQSTKLQEQETAISDLKKHMEECDQKFSELTSEVNRSRDDFLKTIFPTISPLNTKHSENPPVHKTVIRPRISHVQGPNTYIVELERKRKASIDFEIPHKFRFVSPKPSTAFQLKEKLNKKISENITKNISKHIINDSMHINDTSKKKSDFTSFLSTSLENLLKNPISSIKSRKRRMTDDLNLLD